jgi:hypothetical protein
MTIMHTPPHAGDDGTALRMAWLRARQGGVGSSDTPVLRLGTVYERTLLSLYYEKIMPPLDEGADNPDFRRGRTYEPLALALYAQQHPEVTIRRPGSAAERYADFMIPGPSQDLYADLDGLLLPRDPTQPAWVLEVKCPRQWTIDAIRDTGLKPVHVEQSQHLALVARAAAARPEGLLGWHGAVAGTRVLVYDSESVELLTFDVPHDDAVQADIQARATAFMAVVRDRATDRLAQLQPPVEVPVLPSSKCYVPVTGPAWDSLARDFLAARSAADAAKAEADRLKAIVETTLISARLEKVLLPGGAKVSYTESAGKTSLDKRALQLAHPNIRLADFETRGAPSRSLRVYPAKEV